MLLTPRKYADFRNQQHAAHHITENPGGEKRIRMPNKKRVFGERFVAKWGVEESDRKENDEEKAKNP